MLGECVRPYADRALLISPKKALASEARGLGFDPRNDPGVMVSIIDIYHRAFPYFTKEWVRFMPVVLGNLLPLVDALPPRTPLASFYNLQNPRDPSHPATLIETLAAHLVFEEYDRNYRFATTRFRADLSLVRGIAGRIAAYPPSPLLSDEERSNLTRRYGPVVERCELSFARAQQNYLLRINAFDRITALFSGGAYRTVGDYGSAEYEVFRELWLRYTPGLSYPV
jgi:hypothetical protein